MYMHFISTYAVFVHRVYIMLF